MNQQKTLSRRSAFTLVEMLVVIVLIAVVSGVLFPILVQWSHSGRVQAGMNTVGVGVKAARGYALRTKITPDAPFDIAGYDGVAIIFTPAGEMRLVENDMYAMDHGGAIVEPTLNAYSDIPGRDYIQLPKGMGVVGIVKSNHEYPLLLPPPFAIRFDVHGRMLGGSSATAPDRLVFYDSNHDGQYLTSYSADGGGRDNPYGSAPYVPADWDPDSNDFDQVVNPKTAWDEDEQKWPLPFELIETVVGVIVYSKYDLDKTKLVMLGTVNDFDAANSDDSVGLWLLGNGQPVFFSRYTGAVITQGE